MQVVYCTTPANVFHVLRRQNHREFRKPLIFFFSKSLLRHHLARSKMEDFIGDSHFHRILGDPFHNKGEFQIKPKEQIKRLILCTGQVWTTLHRERQNHNVGGKRSANAIFFPFCFGFRSISLIIDIAITRIEQFHPFPWVPLKANIESYPNLESIIWAQEEHLNAGGWTFVQPRLQTLLALTKYADMDITYCGRDPSARYD